MDERDASERPATTDPETEEASRIEEAAASGDEAAQIALEEAGGRDASADEPPVEAVEALEHEMTDQLEEQVTEESMTQAGVLEVEPQPEPQPEPAAETEDEPPQPAADIPVEQTPAAAEEAVVVAQAAKTAPPSPEAPPAKVSADVSQSPFEGPGEWYVVHTYAGYENKVKANLHSRINSMQMEDKIFDVVIPMEDVMEIKGGKKQVVQRKVFPGYLMVKMIYDNDSWYVVRNTPGVTGFVASGTGTKPTPLSRREVEKILTVKEETQKKPEYRLEWEVDDVVRIIAGPFADFQGTIAEINVEQSKLKVLVNIFDRETPVELAFDQVAKA
jgi:transcription termination/antitermination protein NusG